jgi:hypothetical protein
MHEIAPFKRASKLARRRFNSMYFSQIPGDVLAHIVRLRQWYLRSQLNAQFKSVLGTLPHLTPEEGRKRVAPAFLFPAFALADVSLTGDLELYCTVCRSHVPSTTFTSYCRCAPNPFLYRMRTNACYNVFGILLRHRLCSTNSRLRHRAERVLSLMFQCDQDMLVYVSDEGEAFADI